MQIDTSFSQESESWENIVKSLHFSVYYNTTGSNAVTYEYAVNVSDSLEQSWTKEVTDFNFRAPPDSHMKVYILDIEDYGITYYSGPPYHVNNITIDTTLTVDLIRVTCAHEFFHTIQLSYDITEGDWIIEGTATWIESKVYPYFTGSGSYIDWVNAYMSNPDRAITTLNCDAAIFWIYLDEHLGGISTIENVLQQTTAKDGIYAVNATLNLKGTDFSKTFRNFTIANMLKDKQYLKGYLFNEVAKTTFIYSGSRLEFSSSVADWGAKYYEATSSFVYMEAQFIGEQHQNVTKILLDNKGEMISDMSLSPEYNGSFRLMQADLLDKIVIIVKSIVDENLTDRRNYLLVFLGVFVNQTGPYQLTSSQTSLSIHVIGSQTSSIETAEVFSVSIQTSATPITNVIDYVTLQRSSTHAVTSIAQIPTQTSSQTTISTVPHASLQSSTQPQTAVVNETSTQSSSSLTLQVGLSPPIASFNFSPLIPAVNTTITFDASASCDPDGFISSYTWDFGDGNITITTSQTLTHSYTEPATYTVILNVTDNQGFWDVTSKPVTVNTVTYLAVRVENLTITDQNGNPKNTFHAGEILQCRFVLANIGSINLTNGLVSVTLTDPAATTVFLTYTFDSVQSGETKEFIIGGLLPANSIVGTYTLKVMIFTDWPSKGGAALEVKTSTVDLN